MVKVAAGVVYQDKDYRITRNEEQYHIERFAGVDRVGITRWVDITVHVTTSTASEGMPSNLVERLACLLWSIRGEQTMP